MCCSLSSVHPYSKVLTSTVATGGAAGFELELELVLELELEPHLEPEVNFLVPVQSKPLFPDFDTAFNPFEIELEVYDLSPFDTG